MSVYATFAAAAVLYQYFKAYSYMMRTYPFRILFILSLILNQAAPGQVHQWGDTTGTVIHNGAGAQRNPVAVATGDGGAWFVFESVNGASKSILAQRVDAEGKRIYDSTGIVVASSSNSMTLIDAVPSAEGFIACWIERKASDSQQRIYMQRIGPGGAILWNDGGIAVFHDGLKLGPSQCISDSSDGVIVCSEDRSITGNANVIAQRIGPGGTAVWNAAGIVAASSPLNERQPRLSPDGSGGCFIVWTEDMNNGDIGMQRISHSGELLWSSDGINVTQHPAIQNNPRLATIGGNRCLVVWEDYRTRDSVNIYLGIVNSTGAVQLIDTVCDAAGAQWLSDVAADGSGGALIAWVDYRSSSDGDIYLRRINKEGMLLWGTRNNGASVCTAASIQEQPRLLGDGFGGVMIAWQDKRNTADFDLWMQSLDSNGVRRWQLNGARLIGEAMNQIGLNIAASSPGSALCVWTDGRVADGISDIYAQKIGFTPVIFFPDSVTFQPVRYGSEAVMEIPLTNAGPGPMEITSFFISGSQSTDFIFAEQLPLPLTLREHDTIPVRIIFRPRSSGYRMSRLYVRGMRDGNSFLHPPYAIPLSGFCNRPDFDVFPRRIDFAVAKVGASQDSVLPWCLHNTGIGPLEVQDITIEGPSAESYELLSPSSFPFTIPSGDSAGIALRFTSSMNNLQYAMLTVRTNGINASRTIFLRGVGGEYPVATVMPNTLEFDTSSGRDVLRSLTVKAGAILPVSIFSATFEGTHPGDFSTAAILPRDIPSGDSLEVEVAFHPASNGEKRAYLRLRTDLLQPDILISLHGTGVNIQSTGVESNISPSQVDLSLYPNPLPMSSILSIHLVIPRSWNTTVSIYSPLGVKIVELFSGVLEQGMHQIEFSTAGLHPGAYFCIVESAKSRTLMRAFVLR